MSKTRRTSAAKIEELKHTGAPGPPSRRRDAKWIGNEETNADYKNPVGWPKACPPPPRPPPARPARTCTARSDPRPLCAAHAVGSVRMALNQIWPKVPTLFLANDWLCRPMASSREFWKWTPWQSGGCKQEKITVESRLFNPHRDAGTAIVCLYAKFDFAGEAHAQTVTELEKEGSHQNASPFHCQTLNTKDSR